MTSSWFFLSTLYIISSLIYYITDFYFISVIFLLQDIFEYWCYLKMHAIQSQYLSSTVIYVLSSVLHKHSGVVALLYFGVNKRVIKIKNTYIYSLLFTLVFVNLTIQNTNLIHHIQQRLWLLDCTFIIPKTAGLLRYPALVLCLSCIPEKVSTNQEGKNKKWYSHHK